MAVRHRRGAGHRRAAPGSALFVALAATVYLAAGVLAAWPAVKRIDQGYLAGGAPGHGETAAGDHLQTGYNLWLPGHQLENGQAPWRDPYAFRPESGGRVNPAAWPFSIPYWPLYAALGPVWAWNVFILLTYVFAGLAACAWLRELGLPRGPSLLGGLAFSIAPYRVAQSGGHLLGPISALLPLALFAFERGRRGSRWWSALAAVALASIPLSGQVHVALGAIPFFVVYALVRDRSRRALAGTAVAALAAVAAGLLVDRLVIAGSIAQGGRSLAQVASYSAQWADLVSRTARHGSESIVFLGWATALLAVAGLFVLLRERRYGIAATLGLGAVVPVLLALGTNLPSYSWLWRHFGPLRYPRVPERLMPVACLAIAALLAFAVARIRRYPVAVAAVLLVGIAADLKIHLYGISAPDQGNAAYAALRRQPPGRLVEVPVFLPDVHYGSVYMSYSMQTPRERPFGYSTLARPAVRDLARRLERLNCGDWSGDTRGLLGRLGVTDIAFHGGLFVNNAAVPDRRYFAWLGLERAGFAPVATGGVVTLFATGRGSAPPPAPEPARDQPVFCQGWYQHGPRGPMSEPHAPFWVYGGGTLRLAVFSLEPLPATFSVDGHEVARRTVKAPVAIFLPLGRPGWHVVTVDVPHLVATPGRAIGLELVSVNVVRG